MNASLKIQYVGALHMVGRSKKDGRDYDMCHILYLADPREFMGNLQTVNKSLGKISKQKAIPVSVFESLKEIMPLSWVDVVIGVDPEDEDKTIFTSVKMSTNQPTLQINKPTK